MDSTQVIQTIHGMQLQIGLMQYFLQVLWFSIGVASCFIYNKSLDYEGRFIKYSWLSLACLLGGISLFISLHYMIRAINSGKKIRVVTGVFP